MSRKTLLVKVGCWHAIKNVNCLLGDISVFRNADKWCTIICYESDIRSVKSLTFYTFTALKFSACIACAGFLVTLKVCTNTKKVDNHWSSGWALPFQSHMRHVFWNFWKVCNTMICQAIELESCSNPLQIQQVLNCKSHFFGVGFPVSHLTIKACFWISGEFTWPWAATE